jgi:hypothetical protein
VIQKPELAGGRAALAFRERVVARVRDWLVKNVAAIATPGVSSSYGMKHVGERALDVYVSNEELIAAALLARYRTRRWGGPNALVAFSRRDEGRVRNGRRAVEG